MPLDPNSPWQTHLHGAQKNLATIRKASTELDQHRAALAELQDEATAQVVTLGRNQGIEVNVPAVQASFREPYVLRRLDDKTWSMTMWRGRGDLPIIGQFDFQTDGFVVSTVTPSSRLFSYVPSWVDDVTGFRAAPFAVALDLQRGALEVRNGNPQDFQATFRSHLGKALDERTFKIQGGAAWLKFLKSLLDHGIAPVNRQAVKPDDWDDRAPCQVKLRPYQVGYVEQFRQDGSITIVLPSGAGKTWIALYIISHLKGRQYIFCDTDFLVGQWKARLKEYAPHAEVEVMTYQAAAPKAEKLSGVFALSDEGHRLPAPRWSRLAFGKFTYQASMTATVGDPERRTMLFALGGPCRITPWQDLLAEGVLNRPTVEVLRVPNLAFKIQWLKEALSKHRAKRVLVYCDSLELGHRLQRELGIPFVYGETRHKFEAVTNARHCILSKAIETALDLTDLELIVEVDVSHTGRSVISAGQRAGRGGHSLKTCRFVTLMTPAEYARFGTRLAGIEMMYGDVITYRDLMGADATSLSAPQGARPWPSRRRPAPVKPGDAAGRILASPAIHRLILDEEKHLGATRQGYSALAFRVLWKYKRGTSHDLRLKMGKAEKTWEWYQAGLNALVRAGLAKFSADKAYSLNLARIRELSGQPIFPPKEQA